MYTAFCTHKVLLSKICHFKMAASILYKVLILFIVKHSGILICWILSDATTFTLSSGDECSDRTRVRILTIPQPLMEEPKCKLAVPSGWEEQNTFSPLSIRMTLANCRCL